jgi:hypothetical protein
VKTTPAFRTTINVDGHATVPVPDKVANRPACAGAIVAVYTGASAPGDTDLPRHFDMETNMGQGGFSARVAAHWYTQAQQWSTNCPVA